MSFFRTRQRVIEAVQYRFGMKHEAVHRNPGRGYVISTLDGVSPIRSGDWIITEGDGRFSLCEANKFRELYETSA